MKKRRFVGAILIVMALLVMLIPAAEADAVTSASAFSIKSGELVKYTGSNTTVSVPDTVTSIGRGAFENNTSVEKIILPDSVKQIRPYAFWGCDNLKTVTLGKGLTNIGDYAFCNCTGLETMTIPKNVTSIGIQSFANCQRFEDITIPYQVSDIKNDAFDGDYLLNIHCEEGSYADKYAKDFYERQKEMVVYDDEKGNDISQNHTVSVPADGVYSGADIEARENGKSQLQPNGTMVAKEDANGVIGSTSVVGNQAYVFFRQMGIPVIGDESGLASAEVIGGRDRLDQIEASRFADVQDGSADTQTDAENGQMLLIDGAVRERAYYRDDTYTHLALPDDTRQIGRFAFARSGIRQANLPDGLETIEYAAFYHCDYLTKVSLPETVKNVEAKAFAHTAWMDEFLAGGGEDITEDFLISGGVLLAYRGDDELVTIPEGVRVIAGEAFADQTQIKEVVFPTTLQTICDRAFAGCNLIQTTYKGTTLSGQVIEETVNMQTLSKGAANTPKNNSILFIVCALMLLVGGGLCIFRQKY